MMANGADATNELHVNNDSLQQYMAFASSFTTTCCCCAVRDRSYAHGNQAAHFAAHESTRQCASICPHLSVFTINNVFERTE
jgi:hypothetical protein